MNKTTTRIYCEAGHHWDRPKQRGKRPKFCPQHQPVVEVKSDMQTLLCKAGHTWERPAQRGKKPLWCLEHKPTIQKQVKPGRSTSRYSLDSLLARFPAMDFEDEHKLAYIEQELCRGRELEDENLLLKAQKDIVGRLTREARQRTEVPLEEI